MIIDILNSIINHRNIDDLTTSEARNIVNTFYNKLALLTVGCSKATEDHIDYLSKCALDEVGLGYFA